MGVSTPLFLSDILLYRFYFIIYTIVIINCLKFNIPTSGKYSESELVCSRTGGWGEGGSLPSVNIN